MLSLFNILILLSNIIDQFSIKNYGKIVRENRIENPFFKENTKCTLKKSALFFSTDVFHNLMNRFHRQVLCLLCLCLIFFQEGICILNRYKDSDIFLVKETCSLKNEPSILFQKQNDSNFHNIIRRFRQDNVQPSLKVCIVTRITKDIYDYAAFSYSIMLAYSRYRNYFHFPILLDSSADDYEYHRKLIPVIEILESPIYRCDYVVWTDAGNS